MYGLEEYRRDVQAKKNKLIAFRDHFKQEADREVDEFKNKSDEAFAKCMEIMEDLFSNIETWAIAQAALKAQIDILRDIIIQLPEVKNNEKIQRDLDDLTKQYDSSF
jgi:uncharacterized UPF0160 family protein